MTDNQTLTDNQLSDSSIITKQSLYELHQNYQNRVTAKPNTKFILDIVEALGGIHQILTNHLATDEIATHQNKRNRIHDILTESKAVTELQNTDIQNDKTSQNDLCYVFDENDTYLHLVFGESKAMKIIHVLHHKITKIIFIAMIITFVIIVYTVPYPYTVVTRSYQIFVSLVICTYLIIYILSVNASAFKIIVKSFDFWIKAVYSVLFAVMYLGYQFGVRINWSEREYPAIRFLSGVILWCNVILLTILVSLFDGFHTNTIWKVFMSGASGLVFLVYSVYLTLFVDEDDEKYLTCIGGEVFCFSSVALRSSACRILTIFMLKQAGLAYWKKNESVSIVVHPMLKWNINQQKEDQEMTETAIKLTQ